jgi:hypothetical protein
MIDLQEPHKPQKTIVFNSGGRESLRKYSIMNQLYKEVIKGNH